MAWPDEKEALLATIRRQEQKSTALAKRFKLLQRTLQEQQKLLDKYQHALSTFQAAQRADAHLERKNGDGKLGINNTSSCKKLSSSTSPSWIQKKTTNSSDLGPVKENEAETQVKKQVQEKNEKTSSFKFPSKRAKSQLAATWAEEKEKMLKKHKWEQSSKSTTSNADKENYGTETREEICRHMIALSAKSITMHWGGLTRRIL
ncbi:uncharacterized protein PHALS_05154 [Plasmopara halstedii]|uniref:Uncharacterized protein n=1 Tax=Plasmopara halstedii TaxID=4781 RepID=A0A0P1B0C5_PLAHL|nr:uncharacterized protein PHALS_05154 [Plasmopara halstedii]CEG47820.1 hypothetical protein PHALS_05154 [Plasmopara halstedii]|eukprot:XP_024584189.1 hypothetical protein PHALS_05154 [Plasmopara halstedii]